MLNQIITYLPFLVVLIFFSIPFILPGLKRTRRLSKIAQEFGLHFKRKGKQIGSMFITFESREMNVISGSYNGKEISISDIDKRKGYGTGDLLAHLTQINGVMYPRLNVNQIFDYLKYQKDPTTHKYNSQISYNSGMLIILSILGITVSCTFFILLENLNEFFKYLICIIIFSFFAGIGHMIARKTPYKYSGLMTKDELKNVTDLKDIV